MQNKLSFYKEELRSSNSFISEKGLSKNSSFTVLPDGSIKRKRVKSSYKEIYLEKVNYRSPQKTFTQGPNQSYSYSKYKLQKRDSDIYGFDEMSYTNNASKTKENITTTQTSSYFKEWPKQINIDLPFSVSTDNFQSKKGDIEKQIAKGKGILKLDDVVDFNYPLQITQDKDKDKELKGSRNAKKKKNDFENVNVYYDEVVVEGKSNEKSRGLINDNYNKELEKYLNESNELETNELESNKENQLKAIKQRNECGVSIGEDTHTSQLPDKEIRDQNDEEDNKGNYNEEDNEFSVHESDNYRYDVINSEKNNDNDTNANNACQLMGSSSVKNDENDNDNNQSNNIDNEDNDQNQEECHQIQLSNDDQDDDIPKNQKQKEYRLISEIVEEENEDALLNSQKHSSVTDKRLTSSNCNRKNDNADSLSLSKSNNGNQLLDNRMSIEELNALNEEHAFKSSNRAKTHIKKQYGFNDNELKQMGFSVNISQCKLNVGYSESHMQIQIVNDNNKAFKGMRIIKNNYFGINKTRSKNNENKTFKTVQYSICIPGFAKEKEKREYKIHEDTHSSRTEANRINMSPNSQYNDSHDHEHKNADNENDYNENDYNEEQNPLSKLKSKKPNDKPQIKETRNLQSKDDNHQYPITDSNQQKESKFNIQSLWTPSKAVTPMITISDLIMPNGCIQKKNVVNINKHKEADFSKIQIDDLISQIKDKTAKKYQKKQRAEQNFNDKPVLFSVTDSPNKNNYKSILHSRPESTGNIINIKDRDYINAFEEMFHSETRQRNNQDLALSKNDWILKNNIDYVLQANQQQQQANEFTQNIKKSKQININPNKQFVMPANTLETLLLKKEEKYLASKKINQF